MKIGFYDFNPDFWKRLSYDKFLEKYKGLNLEKETGEKPEKLAKKLGIEIPDIEIPDKKEK